MLRWITEEIADQADRATNEEKGKHSYYAECPQCGKRQVKESLLTNGCFVCGWKGTEEDIELTAAKAQSGLQVGVSAEHDAEKGENCGKNDDSQTAPMSYKTSCPQCGASLITDEFLKNGCWRCGYKN